MSEATRTLKIRPDADLRAFLIALITRNGGELYISHEELGEAAVKVFDQQIVAEQREDGTVYRIADSEKCQPDRGCLDGDAHDYPNRWEANSNTCRRCGAMSNS